MVRVRFWCFNKNVCLNRISQVFEKFSFLFSFLELELLGIEVRIAFLSCYVFRFDKQIILSFTYFLGFSFFL